MSRKLNILIGGYIVGGPLGGLVWHHLQYVVGLHRLGHNVLFIEDSDDYPSCYNPETLEVSTDPSYGLKFINEVFTNFNLKDNWAYYNYHSNTWYGKTREQIESFIDQTDIFFNLSGIYPWRDFIQKIPVRVLIDTDPAFTQIDNIQNTARKNLAQSHTHFFSFGENFGKQSCSMPDDGFDWQPTRQPVVMDLWNFSPGNISGKWTTVMQWDSYKTRELDGRKYGMKSFSFMDYLDLPSKTNDTFEVAIGSASTSKINLLDYGWKSVNPLEVTKTHKSYQDFIKNSKGEWSIAKQGYLITRCGWFSERTTCYLASGRPVIVQDTGFSEFIETGKGLHCFSNEENILIALEKINGNYATECVLARNIVKEYFNSNKVLSGMLNKLT